MKHYSLYAKLIKKDDGTDVINIMSSMYVKRDGFRFLYSIPFINALPFLARLNLKYMGTMVILSLIFSILYSVMLKFDQFSIGFDSGYIARSIIAVFFALGMGHVGGILEKKSLQSKGFTLVFQAVEKNAKNFLLFFYSHVTLIPGGVVVKNELCKSFSK